MAFYMRIFYSYSLAFTVCNLLTGKRYHTRQLKVMWNLNALFKIYWRFKPPIQKTVYILSIIKRYPKFSLQAQFLKFITLHYITLHYFVSTSKDQANKIKLQIYIMWQKLTNYLPCITEIMFVFNTAVQQKTGNYNGKCLSEK
jgi:hypothetical protein